MITALRSPTQPSWRITMKSGTTPSCVGTAIVAITNTSSPRRPRNRSFAKLNPARVAKNTVDTEQMVATSTELITAGQKLMSEWITALMFSKKFGPGIGDGMGLRAISPASEEDSRNV